MSMEKKTNEEHILMCASNVVLLSKFYLPILNLKTNIFVMKIPVRKLLHLKIYSKCSLQTT